MVEAPAVGIRAAADSTEVELYASLYREALNTNSSIYRFLCLFKVIEGVLSRRARFDRSLVHKGCIPKRPPELLPSDPEMAKDWLNALFPYKRHIDSVSWVFPPETFGKRMNWVIGTRLRPLRNRIAHAILDSGEMTLSTDQSFELVTVETWLPLTKCMTRHLLSSEFPGCLNVCTPRRPDVEVVSAAEAAPHDNVYESPAMSNIRVMAQRVNPAIGTPAVEGDQK